MDLFFLVFFCSSVFGAEKFTPPTPQTLVHWVRLTDGSLLIGRVESIDAEQLRIDLRQERKTIISVSRRNVASLVVIPPVDPVLAKDYLEPEPVVPRPVEPEPVVPDQETVLLVDGETLFGRLRSFSKGIFRFDLAFGGSDGLFLESQPIFWHRVRKIRFRSLEEKNPQKKTIFLSNGSKIFCDSIENALDGVVLVKCEKFSVLELPRSTVIFPPNDR